MGEQVFPEPTVGALIFNDDGKMLLVRSHKWKGKWVMPGGHIELGETAITALRREIKEETNLDIDDIRFVCLQEFIFDDAFWKKKHFIFMDYACKAKPGEVALDSVGQEFTWVTLKESLDMPVDPYTKHTIEEFLKRFPDGF